MGISFKYQVVSMARPESHYEFHPKVRLDTTNDTVYGIMYLIPAKWRY